VGRRLSPRLAQLGPPTASWSAHVARWLGCAPVMVGKRLRTLLVRSPLQPWVLWPMQRAAEDALLEPSRLIPPSGLAHFLPSFFRGCGFGSRAGGDGTLAHRFEYETLGTPPGTRPVRKSPVVAARNTGNRAGACLGAVMLSHRNSDRRQTLAVIAEKREWPSSAKPQVRAEELPARGHRFLVAGILIRSVRIRRQSWIRNLSFTDLLGSRYAPVPGVWSDQISLCA
jgi:hypothetical protein